VIQFSHPKKRRRRYDKNRSKANDDRYVHDEHAHVLLRAEIMAFRGKEKDLLPESKRFPVIFLEETS